MPGVIVREAESFDRGNVLIDTTHYGPGIGVILNKGELPNFAEYDVGVATDGLYRIEIRHTASDARPVRMRVDGNLIASDVASSGDWLVDARETGMVSRRARPDEGRTPHDSARTRQPLSAHRQARDRPPHASAGADHSVPRA